MNQDITPFIESWKYHPGQINVRRIRGIDGKDKIQMRLDLGVLQMECDGRPDGQRPFGKDSLLEHYESLLKEHHARAGTTSGFKLDNEDCAKLQQEAIQYYHRYLSLFQLEDYDGVIRDTQRNLRLIDFVTAHADSDDIIRAFQQFKPYLLMMNTRGKAINHLLRKEYDLAIHQVEWGVNQIREVFITTHHEDLMEANPELKFLNKWLQEIKDSKPLTTRQKLQRELKAAIEREDYERAANLRDQLHKLETETSDTEIF